MKEFLNKNKKIKKTIGVILLFLLNCVEQIKWLCTKEAWVKGAEKYDADPRNKKIDNIIFNTMLSIVFMIILAVMLRLLWDAWWAYGAYYAEIWYN